MFRKTKRCRPLFCTGSLKFQLTLTLIFEIALRFLSEDLSTQSSCLVFHLTMCSISHSHSQRSIYNNKGIRILKRILNIFCYQSMLLSTFTHVFVNKTYRKLENIEYLSFRQIVAINFTFRNISFAL